MITQDNGGDSFCCINGTLLFKLICVVRPIFLQLLLDYRAPKSRFQGKNKKIKIHIVRSIMRIVLSNDVSWHIFPKHKRCCCFCFRTATSPALNATWYYGRTARARDSLFGQGASSLGGSTISSSLLVFWAGNCSGFPSPT